MCFLNDFTHILHILQMHKLLVMNGFFFSDHSYLACRSMLEGNGYFQIPEVVDELSGRRVLAMELVQGVPLDRCVDLDQETRNQVRVD